MTKTKRALLMSGLALLLCVSMLVGSTYAWFTDSVTSTGNIIKSGTLDVTMHYADGTEAVPAIDSADWADAASGAIFNYDKWEPGYVEVRHIKIANVGTLALKYQLFIEANGTVSDLAKVIDVYYADPAVKVEGRAMTELTRLGTLEEVLAGMATSASGNLEANTNHTVTLALKMRESAGNEYQDKSIGTDFSVKLFATQLAYENDSFDNQYDANAAIYVDSQSAAQAALDNAKNGDVIVLAPANYGTLYMRPTTNTNVTKTVDWQGNNYGWETYSLFENITILGTTGAVVDAIEIEGGTYYNSEHSQNGTYPVMLSLVELKNVVIDGVTFTGNGGQYGDAHGNAICLAGNNIKVDGLTLKNCVLKDSTNNNRLLYKSEGTTQVHTYTYDGETYTFTPSLKDITITGCTFNGGYMGLELRETENVTITNNVFNVANRNILLPVNTDCTYSGNITITGNVSNNAKERFVRADGTGDAVVVIKDNILNAYMSADADYVKVTNGNNVTIENNTITYGSTAALQAALDNAKEGATIDLAPGVDFGTVYLRPTAANVTKVTCFPGLCDYMTTSVDAFKAHWANENTGGGGHVPCYEATIKNVTIVGADGATVAGVQAYSGHASAGTTDAVLGDANTGTYYVALNISNITFKEVAFTGKVNIESSHEDAVYDGVTFDGCSFTTGGTAEANGAAIRYHNEDNDNGKVRNITVKDCTFQNCRQGVYTHHVNGITVIGCTFDTLGHNAVAVQAHSNAAHGNVVITDNTFKNIGDRVIRFNEVDAPTNITIQYNVATNCGDEGSQVMKATSIAPGVTTSISDNNWGDGKIVANNELKDE